MTRSRTFTAFLGTRRLAAGAMSDIVQALSERPEARTAVVFDDVTGDLVKVGGPRAPAATTAATPVSRTSPSCLPVTLLPRHVEWLEAQPGGPSAALRRLVDQARKDGTGRPRQARDAGYRFMSMVAGDLPGFEEACRALYAGDAQRFALATEAWPHDYRAYARRIADEGLA